MKIQIWTLPSTRSSLIISLAVVFCEKHHQKRRRVTSHFRVSCCSQMSARSYVMSRKEPGERSIQVNGEVGGKGRLLKRLQ